MDLYILKTEDDEVVVIEDNNLNTYKFSRYAFNLFTEELKELGEILSDRSDLLEAVIMYLNGDTEVQSYHIKLFKDLIEENFEANSLYYSELMRTADNYLSLSDSYGNCTDYSYGGIKNYHLHQNYIEKYGLYDDLGYYTLKWEC